MIEKFIENIRLFSILVEGVRFHNIELKKYLAAYINKYIKFKNLSAKDLESNYESFLEQYLNDIKYFLETKKYPAISPEYAHKVNRTQYDIALLLSTLLSQHRFDLMHEVWRCANEYDKGLVIGCGIGLEIELIKHKYKELDAYDLSVDSFCYQTHPKVNFYEEEFLGQKEKIYNDIYIIELLEHVKEPYNLLKDALKVLNISGRIIITLAIDIPQFDHVYNFNNLDQFNSAINDLGLYVEYDHFVEHKSLLNKLKTSSNIFMILRRK